MRYSFIFIQGMMIALPLILVLIFGIADADQRIRPFEILADLGLISLAVMSCKKKTKGIIALEWIVYPILLSPLIRMLTIFPLQMFNYPLFIIPFCGFVILYPISVLFSWLEFRQK